ncbi:MAG: hypothetical protein IJ664_00840, partial [Clostridia bacterium]|nr:hypothetical protein [Clostridia bacterium]
MHFQAISASLAYEVSAKSRLGPMKNPTAVWYEQARPAICRIFQDCFAILGLLRMPTQTRLVSYQNMDAAPTTEMTALAVNNA